MTRAFVPLPPIRLLVADMAGTTVRDDGLVEESFTDAISAFGLTPDMAEFDEALAIVRSTMGMSKIDVFERILGDRDEAARATTRFETSIGERISAGLVQPLDGAVESLTAIAELGVSVVLTTGFADSTREQLLDQLGWHELIVASYSPSDEFRGRPYPDLVLEAARLTRIDDVREIATVGDTTNDLWSGWRAGASIVAGVLTGAHNLSALESAPHTHVLASINLLPEVIEERNGGEPEPRSA
jgi:phosphonatase-like hydrolase